MIITDWLLRKWRELLAKIAPLKTETLPKIEVVGEVPTAIQAEEIVRERKRRSVITPVI